MIPGQALVAAASSPPRKGSYTRNLLGRTRGGDDQPSRALARSPLLAERARALECNRRRAPLPWGKGDRVKTRARQKPREGGGEAGERGRPRELGEASARARGGLDRSPRALASSRGRRPSPTRLARSLTLSPAAAAAAARCFLGEEVLPLLELLSL